VTGDANTRVAAAVLRIHRDSRATQGGGGQCEGCLAVDPGAFVPWPCATVTAVWKAQQDIQTSATPRVD
jgi:hypothetical protein